MPCNGVRRNYNGGVDLLEFFIKTERSFNCHHALLDFKSTKDDIRDFIAWTLHCILFVGSKGYYKEAAASVISRIIFSAERISSAYSDSYIDAVLSLAYLLVQRLSIHGEKREADPSRLFRFSLPNPIEKKEIKIGNILMSLRPQNFEISSVVEAYNFMFIVCQVISSCISQFLAMRPSMVEGIFDILAEIIDFADLNGKLECTRAVSCCLDALLCTEELHSPSLLSKVFQLSSSSLKCLTFLSESKHKCMALFYELKMPEQLVLSCCDLISRVCQLISMNQNNWNGPSSDEFSEMIETYKSTFISLSGSKLPRNKCLTSALMKFFCQNSSSFPEISPIHVQLCDCLIQDQKFRECMLFHADEKVFSCADKEAFRYQAIDFFAVAFNRIGVTNLQLHLNSFLLNIPDWPSLSLITSAFVRCIDLDQCWYDPVIATLPSIVSNLISAFIPTTQDVESSFLDLVGRINLFSDLLASSLSGDLLRELDLNDLKRLWKFFENLSSSSDMNTHLLAISLRASLLLLTFLKSRGIEPHDMDFLPLLLNKVLIQGNLYWIEDTPTLDRFVWSESIVPLFETTLGSLSDVELGNSTVLNGLLSLSRIAICVSWSTAVKDRCRRCHKCKSTTAASGSRTLKMSIIRKLLELMDENLPLQIELSLHAAQHLSWDICSEEEIKSFVLTVLSWIAKVEYQVVAQLRYVITSIPSPSILLLKSI
ncbi:unnamed protein product [Rodentolepis nana]|uniref:Non-specific serine/threonine protein kinase n=1 Tax=Rodentolepis nana TaxID=102285 RepID=A0A0R3TAL7_RODNA|nr:unnamed protein product [Rodentolepis nana]